MAISALSLAHDALRLGPRGNTDFNSSLLGGRAVSHWSARLLAGGALIGVIALVVGLVFADNILVAEGALLFLTNAVGGYYIGKFSVFHEADELIRALAARIYQYWEQVVALELTVYNAGQENRRLGALVSEYRTLVEQHEQLKKDRTEAIKKLETTEGRLRSLVSSVAPLRAIVDRLLAETGKIGTSHHAFQDNVAAMGKHVQQLAAARDRFQEDLDKLGLAGDTLVSERKELKQAIDAAAAVTEQWFAKIAALQQDNQSIERDNKALQETVAALHAENKHMSEILTLFEKRILPAIASHRRGTSSIRRYKKEQIGHNST